ncbi:hypothetical protein [Glycomyces algeriensis]|uniref:Dolichyl-phosphate-mannose-protein mannosyltransferase n=1 Tax=Glycomyces algeriensis TaxID=256037 RepID=A0A9W6G616_9ACTN|nr:hypothetical protein [Glycomyces algeriensis]MDA1368970.1 hypothetical protein [Glycomyces algeriensis]MDR7353287.1 hypothetical protein [Glycomyces algeriensis]GLI40982.1 hypothetical protein GALLR39Z86_08320 [Glycomyces algeriensis]
MLLVMWLLILLPALAYALRPRDGAVLAPARLAVVRASILLGAYAIGVVEAASAFTALTTLTVLIAWVAATVAVVAAVLVRAVRDVTPDGGSGGRGQPFDALREELRSRRGATRRTWRRTKSAAAAAPAWQWGLGCVIAILAISVAVLAISSSPNNFDSQTYHLPRIEHWIQNASVAVYPTDIHRQVDIGPGSEYLLTHLRLLSGGDGAYNLLQFLAAIGAALAASRIAAQLGGGPVAQLATVFILATTPEVLLQASSTQVDLVAAAWVACLATIVLDEFTRPGETLLCTPAPRSDALYLGLALGLIAVTKSTGLLAAAPLLLIWGVGRLMRDGRRRRPCLCGRSPQRCSRADASRTATARTGTIAASLAVLAIALLLVGPFMLRMQQAFGHPLGPEILRESIGVQTLDPRLLLVNGLRIAQTNLDTPLFFLSDAFAAAINGLANLMGVDPNDPRITFGTSTFPVRAWYPDEDRAAFPITGLAALAGLVWFAVKGPGLRRAYAAALAVAFIGVVCTVSWQPWVNRLVMFLVVLGAPAAGLFAAALVKGFAATARERGRRRAACVLVTVIAVVASLAGLLTVAYGYPRRLAGTWSVFSVTDLEERFVRRQEWLPQYEEAAAAVAAADPERVGIVQGNDSWEYPWWILLPEDAELYALQSIVPGQTPPDPASMDAIVCAEDLDECANLVPAGWEYHELGTVGYALPPAGP